MTLQALLNQARQQLAVVLNLPPDEARIEAHILLAEALNATRAWMITHADQALSPEQITRFDGLLQRRLAGEPVAYILGRREFYGLDLAVRPGVLIPRPDTETLVEAALRLIPEDSASNATRVLDLGTGSGAIALAIAINRPMAYVTAVDRSPEALAVARENAARLDARNLRVLESDWFSGVPQQDRYDIIVSNPPYIADADPHLAQGDLRFEPSAALASGRDGLADIRRIVEEAPCYMAAGGWLLLEHGYDQAAKVAALLVGRGFVEVGHAADLAGVLRVTFGRSP